MRSIELLIGVPCDWPAFQRAAQDPQRDWLRHVGARAAAAWQGRYEREVALPLSILAREAQALGLHVVLEARLDDLAWATRRAEVVIVITHWKSDQVVPEDLLCTQAEAFVQRIQGMEAMSALALQLRGVRHAKEIAGILQEHVAAAATPPPASAPGSFEVRGHPGTLRALRRDEIDALFEGLFRPGNRLELADGLHSALHIERSIDSAFDGVLDLTACQARVLADLVDHRRRGTCGVIQFERDVMPDLAALGVMRTLELCARDPAIDYLDARTRALHTVFEAVNEEVGRTRWARLWRWLHAALHPAIPVTRRL